MLPLPQFQPPTLRTAVMIDPKMLGDLAKDHQKNLMTRDEAMAFLKDLKEVCRRHRVFLRTSDQTVRFSQVFEDSGQRTVLRAMIDREGRCPAAHERKSVGWGQRVSVRVNPGG